MPWPAWRDLDDTLLMICTIPSLSLWNNTLLLTNKGPQTDMATTTGKISKRSCHVVCPDLAYAEATYQKPIYPEIYHTTTCWANRTICVELYWVATHNLSEIRSHHYNYQVKSIRILFDARILNFA